jgi:hypothetical protein
MVIDDLANREHDCALLLDANFYLHLNRRYKGLTPLGTSLLLGPQYALLRSEFLQVERSEKRTGDVRRIFAFFGGSDPTNETEKLLTALQHIQRRTFELDIVVGAGNPRKQEIERKCRLLENVHFFCQIDNIAELMAHADLAIGAGGTTLWERCYLALPSIVIAAFMCLCLLPVRVFASAHVLGPVLLRLPARPLDWLRYWYGKTWRIPQKFFKGMEYRTDPLELFLWTNALIILDVFWAGKNLVKMVYWGARAYPMFMTCAMCVLLASWVMLLMLLNRLKRATRIRKQHSSCLCCCHPTLCSFVHAPACALLIISLVAWICVYLRWRFLTFGCMLACVVGAFIWLCEHLTPSNASSRTRANDGL